MEISKDIDNIEVIAGKMEVIAESDSMEVSADPDKMEVRINMDYSSLETRLTLSSPNKNLIVHPDCLNVSTITTSGCVKCWRKFVDPNIRCFVVNYFYSCIFTLFF